MDLSAVDVDRDVVERPNRGWIHLRHTDEGDDHHSHSLARRHPALRTAPHRNIVVRRCVGRCMKYTESKELAAKKAVMEKHYGR